MLVWACLLALTGGHTAAACWRVSRVGSWEDDLVARVVVESVRSTAAVVRAAPGRLPVLVEVVVGRQPAALVVGRDEAVGQPVAVRWPVPRATETGSSGKAVGGVCFRAGLGRLTSAVQAATSRRPQV
ncbi:hypothetical protein D5S17_35405 [Pseudonocardiaceae bacterium YIM PH 21723]|nr:hypothetical protein D5S17_35405 [Pseudonocardiaceae bacterium YIM PH 21723]